jgi:hypothetical protein
MKLLVALLFTIFYNYSVQAQQLILPGANPDPSVVKIG